MTLECDDALADLYLYLDSESDNASSSDIRAHLDGCSDCSGSFDFELRLRRVVKERLDEDVPEAVVTRLRIALKREAAGSSG